MKSSFIGAAMENSSPCQKENLLSRLRRINALIIYNLVLLRDEEASRRPSILNFFVGGFLMCAPSLYHLLVQSPSRFGIITTLLLYAFGVLWMNSFGFARKLGKTIRHSTCTGFIILASVSIRFLYMIPESGTISFGRSYRTNLNSWWRSIRANLITKTKEGGGLGKME